MKKPTRNPYQIRRKGQHARANDQSSQAVQLYGFAVQSQIITAAKAEQRGSKKANGEDYKQISHIKAAHSCHI